MDTSLYTEAMMELEQNAKRAIQKRKFGNNSSFGRYVLEQEAEKMPLFFFFFSGDK